MNPNRRVCSCGAESDDGSVVCANCGAVLDADLLQAKAGGGQAQATVGAVADDLTVPMLAPSVGSDSGLDHPLGTVFGSYRLIKQIGSGGMGRVFIAEHTRLGRQVALKVLRSEYSGNVEAVKRFFAEAQAVNRINHENIIEISDFIENPDGPSFYIMELLKGVDLRTLEDREGLLPLDRTLRIAVQVCKGLGAAHDASIVHRDLKPDNIFLVDRGGRTDFVKLLDFGIAKLMNAALDAASTFKSTAGIVVGTPDYMSPEQALGQQVDHRADIYAMGVILFEMVTGRRPFDAMSAREIMVKHMMVAPPRPNRFRTSTSSVPAALEDLILACLKKEPRDRPQSIKDVETGLTDILESLPKSAGVTTVVSRTVRDKRVWAGVGGTLILSVLLLTASRRATRSAESPSAMPSPGSEVSRQAHGLPGQPRVQISFDSTPPGATVLRVGDAQPLGVTPFSAAFDRSPHSQVFEFHIDGWKVGRKHLVLLDNANVEISLDPVDRPPGPARESGPAASDRRRPQLGAKRPVSAKAEGRARGPAQGSSKEAPHKAVKLDYDAVMNPFE